MTTLSLPATPGIKTARFGLSSNTLKFISPLNGAVQTQEFPGAKWFGSFVLPPMIRADAAAWQAFFTQLRGMSGRFFGYDPSARTPRGVATGTPIVNGAGQTGTSLITSGWTINITNILKAGDYFQVGTELKQMTQDVNSSGAGAATLVFEPPLRNAPSNGAPIITINPVCIMMLNSDEQAAWDIDTALHYGMTFSAIESLT
jgi:hypothetical protein